MMSTRRAIGDVRPSQVITTFGPGAIVDLQTLSVVVAGIDRWPKDDDLLIHEPRLEKALRVSRFYAPKPVEGGNFFNKIGTLPAYLFPRYLVCPVCRTLSKAGEEDAEYNPKKQVFECKAPGCKGRDKGRKRAGTMPAPIVTACPGGHLDDFPWREYAHRGPTTCKKRMRFYSIGRTGSVSDLYVDCECKAAKRSMTDAFGENATDVLGECTRRRPWLGSSNHDPNVCQHSKKVRAMQRGATNGWFPLVRSALSIKEDASAMGLALKECNPAQLANIKTIDKLKTVLEMDFFPSLMGFPVEDVWHAMLRERGQGEVTDVDLRYPEWKALITPEASSDQRSEFFLERAEIPAGFEHCIQQVVQARRLLEVRALTGFTRIDTMSSDPDQEIQPNVAPIARHKPDWLPAIEVRGEGIFLQLKEEKVADWETWPAVKARAKVMKAKFEEWERQRGNEPGKFPGARFVLLHTLAHVLIRQLSLDCGYSASSVRERIYSGTGDRKMAGILIYTAAPDSEGSLGGLVDLASRERFPDLLRNALHSATRCSSDPLCSDHQPDAHATINAAACHACVLVAETSCENFNLFLDRNMLVPTMAHSALAFFPDPRS